MFSKIIAGFIDVATYLPTQRGAFKLVHNHYEYYKRNQQFHGAQVWRCVNFSGMRGEKCSVHAYTKNFGLYDKVKIRGKHNHLARLIDSSNGQTTRDHK